MKRLEVAKNYFERLVDIYAEEQTLKNNVEWLIEQAEKVERYEKALKTIESESHDILAKGVCTRALEN